MPSSSYILIPRAVATILSVIVGVMTLAYYYIKCFYMDVKILRRVLQERADVETDLR